MHIATALVSSAVAGSFGASQLGTIGYSLRHLKEEKPVSALTAASAGAFVFSAQMVNFAIPGTGSSGHFTGGMLLAYLLGPKASFLIMSLILTIQSLLFGDGGLMALGCNIFNMAFIPAFIVYPLLFKLPLNCKKSNDNVKLSLGCLMSVVMGAFSVVLQACLSGTIGDSAVTFLTNMVPVHIVIGIAEAGISVCLVNVLKAADKRKVLAPSINVSNRTLALSFFAVIAGAIFSTFASANPDGLEWSLINSGAGELVSNNKVNLLFDKIQSVTSIFGDYSAFSGNSALSTALAGLIGCSLVFSFVIFICSSKEKLAKGTV